MKSANVVQNGFLDENKKVKKNMFKRNKLFVSFIVTSVCCCMFLFSIGTFEEENLGSDHISPYPYQQLSIGDVARLVKMAADSVDGKLMDWEMAAALSAMEFVHANVSGYTTNYVHGLDEYKNFGGNAAEKALYFSHGYCKSKSLCMIEILDELNIICREIQFWNIGFRERSHAALEFFWENDWHFFDPTYMSRFVGEDMDILSWSEISHL